MANYTIQQLECFFTIVDCGNMSKASERLFVTQPSLSKTIQRLEEGLGFKLFEREVNRMRLTSEGEFFYLQAKPLYQKLTALINTAQNMAKGHSMLRIGCYYGCNSATIRETVRRFKEQHPDTEVLVNVMDRRSLRDSLAMGKLDVIISLSYAVKKIVGSQMKPIERTKFYLIVRSDSKMAIENKIDIDLLRQTPIFFCTSIDTQTFEQNDIKRCREIGFEPSKVVYLENYESCLHAVDVGDGVCFGASEELPHNLCAIEIPWLKNRPDVVAVWLSHNNNSSLKEFLSLLPDA